MPDEKVRDLLIALDCPDGRDDSQSARNAASVFRDRCGESGLTRLLDRLAEQIDWAGAAPQHEEKCRDLVRAETERCAKIIDDLAAHEFSCNGDLNKADECDWDNHYHVGKRLEQAAKMIRNR